MKRYDVERRPDVFEDVGATSLAIQDGALLFLDDSNNLVIAYAAGQWITVTPQES